MKVKKSTVVPPYPQIYPQINPQIYFPEGKESKHITRKIPEISNSIAVLSSMMKSHTILSILP